MGFLKRLFGQDDTPAPVAPAPAPKRESAVAMVKRELPTATVTVGDDNDESRKAARNAARIERILDEIEKLKKRIAEGGEHVEARKVKLASMQAELARRTAHLSKMKELIERLGV